MLKLRFPIDGRTNITEPFEVNEPDRVVSRRKTFAEMLLVLVHTLFKIAGDPDIECVTRGTLHHVNVVAVIRVQVACSLMQSEGEQKVTRLRFAPLAMTTTKTCYLNRELFLSPYVCKTPTLNFGTSGLCEAASSAWMMASRVSIGSMILSSQRRAAP